MTGRPALTPLEAWVKTRIGLTPDRDLTSRDLDRHRIDRLRKVLIYARQNSPFYRDRLSGLADDFPRGLDDLAAIPFTTATDLRERSLDLLCVSQSDVARVVTLPIDDPAVPPRRLYFSDHDLERTVDFFHFGMTTLVRPGAAVLILMPGKTFGGIGDLLKKALARMNARGVIHGPVTDPDRALDDLEKGRADCIVGLPSQVLGLARHPRGRDLPPGRVKSVLLSADYVPRAVVRELEDRWGARVFEHYGMTEMGLGGGVQCQVREGYHLREADLLFEVVDPVTGAPRADGETGEVVFTTLTRRAMPLIRYRTGDLSRFLPGPCPCGTVLPRLDRVSGRVAGRVILGSGDMLSLPDIDEALFTIPGLLNYAAGLDAGPGVDRLTVQIYAGRRDRPEILTDVQKRLLAIPAVQQAVARGRLTLGPLSFSPADWPTSGTIKRILKDKRMEPTS